MGDLRPWSRLFNNILRGRARSRRPGTQHGSGRPIAGRPVDTLQVNKWLDSCEEYYRRRNHNDRTHALDLLDVHDSTLELNSRVIDVVRGRIVQAPRSCRYVALSYVWGEKKRTVLSAENEEDLRKDRALALDMCHRTIWDAMVLCKAIGERYLWVDSLCIVQDTAEKHAQIQYMEEIYRGAVLTIAAAAGADADAGLPGMPGTRRENQRMMESALISGLQDFNANVNNPTWNGREWTYQERILSRRLVFFTEGHMFFHCRHGTAREGNVESDPHVHHRLPITSAPAPIDAYKLNLKEAINFNTYAQIVQEYSKRSLTHETDIENAFGGIKKIMSVLFSSEVVFGIPCSALDICLLWYPASSKLTQRKRRWGGNFSPRPSWSWTGWVGEVEYKGVVNLAQRTISAVTWPQPENPKPLKAEGFGKNTVDWPQVRPEDSTQTQRQDSGWLRQMSVDKQIYYLRKNGDRQHWFSHPVARFFHDPVPFDRTSGRLSLSADTVTSDKWDLEYIDATHGHGILIRHRNTGRLVGRVLGHLNASPADESENESDFESVPGNLPFARRHPYKSSSLRFIKISQTTLNEDDKDPAWDDHEARFSGRPGEKSTNPGNMDTSSASNWFDPAAYDSTICWCLYNILMIQYQGSGWIRVGIGKIHVHAFDEVATRGELIRLG